uniref:Transmembrane protein n=1 Tax=Globisporangium ultimum (strain ATCC 200006 / CBS 805.95 / DAOM BR144) TaxID=431595 RepID=K3X087_GLOUD
MALLRRARKDMSMAALVEAHRRHVQAEEEEAEGTGQGDLQNQGEDSEEEWPADAVANEYGGPQYQPQRHRHSYQDSDGEDDEEEEQKRDDRHAGPRYNAHHHPAAPSALRISETDTVTCAGSDENITPDSQGREHDRYHHQQQQRHGLFHYGPPRNKTRGKQFELYDYEEPLQTSSARRTQTKQQSTASPQPYRPAAKVSSALMKPMQMMRDRSLAHRQARRNGTSSGRGGIAIIEGGGDEGSHYYAENERSHNGDHRHSQIDARSVAADGTGLVKVDEKMIRYIDETLVKPDDQVFNRYTRCFHDKTLEHLYQEYTAINWFPRARWHILLLLLVHLLVLLMFVVMPSSGFKSMDQFILSVDAVPTWTQWLYLLAAVPFACLPSDRNPFQKRWRFWACLIVVVFNFAFQLWLAHAGQLALEHFDGIVSSKLQCNTNNTAYLFADRNRTNGSGSSESSWDTIVVNSTTEELSSAALREMSKVQIQFVHAVTYLYAGALVQLLIGFAWLFSFIFAISIRLEFVYVMIIGFSAVIAYMLIVFLFSIPVEWMSTLSWIKC